MKIYKQCTEEPYCFLLKDMTLQLNNPLHYRQKYLEGIYNNNENCNTILIEKLAKISAFSSGRINKYEYLPDE